MVAHSKMLALPVIAMFLTVGTISPVLAQTAASDPSAYEESMSPEPGLEPGLADQDLCTSKFVTDLKDLLKTCGNVMSITAGNGSWTVQCKNPFWSKSISDGTGNKPPVKYSPALTAESLSQCVKNKVCVAKNGTMYCTGDDGTTKTAVPEKVGMQ